MSRKKLFQQLAVLILIIFVLDMVATKLHWYFTIWWFDMPMHFLGGLWLGLFFIYIFPLKSYEIRPIIKTILMVLFVGICWEVFELYFVNHIAENPFNVLDTISDIFFDLAGGTFAILYFFRKNSDGIMFNTENEVK